MSQPLHLARTTATRDHRNTLDLRLEVRDVYYAQGIQAHDDPVWPELVVVDVLRNPSQGWGTMRSKAPLPLVEHSPQYFEYASYQQGVLYRVHRIYTRTEFSQALATEEAFVIYSGHARYGRGPCFGESDAPSEDWEDGNSAGSGLFRMGYPFLAVPVHEVIEHGYTAHAVPSSVTIAAPDCDPDFRPHVARIRPMTAEELGVPLQQMKVKDPSQTWWGYSAFYDQKRTNFVVLHAGWKNTTTSPLDLAGNEMKARVFHHFGCSTYKHHNEVIRTFRDWKLANDRRHCCLTTDLSNGFVTVFYFYNLFAYDKPARGRAWEDSLNYALQKTNQDLASNGFRYRLR